MKLELSNYDIDKIVVALKQNIYLKKNTQIDDIMMDYDSEIHEVDMLIEKIKSQQDNEKEA